MEYDVISWEDINKAIEIIAEEIKNLILIMRLFTDWHAAA